MPRARPVRSLVVALMAALLLAVGAQAASAASALYWTNIGTNTIGQAELDGTSARTTPIADASSPSGLAVATRVGYVYWANFGAQTIGRARVDGSDADADFITGADDPSGVAVDDTHVYWANYSNHTIGRARLDGSDVDADFITGGDGPSGVAVDDTHVYWVNSGTDRIGRANLDGTGVNQGFVATGSAPQGVAVSATHVYWTNDTNAIGRANLDGTGVNTALISPPGLLLYLDADDTHVYWADYGINTIGRANLDGTGTDNNLVTGANGPFGVAAASWTPDSSLTGDGAFGGTIPDSVSDARTLTLTSTGDGPLTVGSATLVGADPGQFRITADTCSGRTLDVGATCTLAVSFAPTSSGAKAAGLTIPGNAPSPATLALSGTGTPLAAPAPPTPTTNPPPATPPPAAPAVPAAAAQSRTDLGRARLRVVTPGAGTLTIRATARIGTRTVVLPATARVAGVVLRLPASVRNRLAKAGRLRISVTATFLASAGGTSTGTRTLPLTAARSRFLRGQWIGRTLGPWTDAPHFTGARRAALRVSPPGHTYIARVMR